MDVIAVLIEAQVYDPVSATTKTLRFTNRNDPRAASYTNVEWRPILQKSPSVGASVFNGDFTGTGGVSIDQFTISLLETDLDDLAAYVWHGAVIKIYAGNLETGVFPLVFTATGNGAARKGKESLTVELKTRDELLQRSLLYLAYAGTGDIEGVIDLLGVLKPMVFGDAKYCKPVLIDPVRQIYQVHGYGPVESIYGCFEGGLAIGTGGNPETSQTLAGGSTYTTFKNLVVAQGQWARFNDLGLVKLGSQPSFPLTVNVKGDNGGVAAAACLQKAADIAKRMITMNVAGVTVKASSITALNTACPYELDFYFDDQININDAVATAMKSIGAYWLWNEIGEVIFGRMRFNASTMTLSALNDQLPTVLNMSQLPTSAPVWSLRFGAAVCHLVHDSSTVPQSLVDLSAAIVDVDTNSNKVFPPGTVPPVGAVDGDLWPDTSTGIAVLRRYNGAAWIATTAFSTDITLVPIGSAVATDVFANSFKRTAAGSGYGYAVRTSVSFANSAYVRTAAVSAAYTAVSLDDDATTTALASQKWTLRCHDDGTWNLYKDGASVANGDVGVIPGGTNVELRYGGTKVEALIGTTVVASQTAPTNEVFWPKVHGYQIGTFSQIAAGFSASNVDATATYTANQQGWAAAIIYKVGDIVQYANSSYICVTAHTSNVLYPPGHATNVQFQILARQGLRTEKIYIRSNATPATPTGDTPASWSTARSATPADTAEWESTGNKDGSNVLVGVWSTPVKVSGQILRGAYGSGVTYYSNDLVTYLGGTYYTLLNNFSGQAPSGTAQANTYWGVQAAPGSQAGSGSQTLTLTLNTSTDGSTTNLRTLADAAGYTGGDLTLTVNITNTYRGPATGYGIRTGTFPTDKTIAITINVNSGGTVEGGGGNGGTGGAGGPGDPGGPGSDAFYIEHNVSGGMIVNAGAAVRSGGGGGGGGGGKARLLGPPGEEELVISTGGNGGGGAPNGIGANNGTTGGGGAGGAGELNTGAGGAGANYNGTGTAGGNATGTGTLYNGGSGGAPGYAVRKNGKTCTVTNNGGTITGTTA